MDHMVFWVKNPGPRAPGNQNKDQKKGRGNPGARRTAIPRQRRPKNEAHVDELAGGENPWVKIVSV